MLVVVVAVVIMLPAAEDRAVVAAV